MDTYFTRSFPSNFEKFKRTVRQLGRIRYFKMSSASETFTQHVKALPSDGMQKFCSNQATV